MQTFLLQATLSYITDKERQYLIRLFTARDPFPSLFLLFFSMFFPNFPSDFRLRDEVSVLSGGCGEGTMEELVDSEENLLYYRRAQLV